MMNSCPHCGYEMGGDESPAVNPMPMKKPVGPSSQGGEPLVIMIEIAKARSGKMKDRLTARPEPDQEPDTLRLSAADRKRKAMKEKKVVGE